MEAAKEAERHRQPSSPTIRVIAGWKTVAPLHLYPLRVFTLLKRWPEAGFRKRSVLPDAARLVEIEDRELAGCIERLAARLSE